MIADFSIGELSRRTGVKVPTIRFYEGAGLLPKLWRTEGGQRRYDPETADRLRFVRHARELGFDLEDIRSLLDIAGDPEAGCSGADSLAAQRLADVESKIARLERLREALNSMIERCAQGRARDCAIISTLANHGHCQGEH
jgi:DNA-binding transcriptional MerR regulator